MNIHAARRYVSPRTRPLNAEEAETRRNAYALKKADPAAIHAAASEMARLICGPCWLVPIPTSQGSIAPNLALALAIAKAIPGARVAPHLQRRAPVESSCDRHRRAAGAIPVDAHGFTRRGPPLTARPLYFVDNVTTSGNTLEAARRAFGFGEGLVYADASPRWPSPGWPSISATLSDVCPLASRGTRPAGRPRTPLGFPWRLPALLWSKDQPDSMLAPAIELDWYIQGRRWEPNTWHGSQSFRPKTPSAWFLWTLPTGKAAPRTGHPTLGTVSRPSDQGHLGPFPWRLPPYSCPGAPWTRTPPVPTGTSCSSPVGNFAPGSTPPVLVGTSWAAPRWEPPAPRRSAHSLGPASRAAKPQ